MLITRLALLFVGIILLVLIPHYRSIYSPDIKGGLDIIEWGTLVIMFLCAIVLVVILVLRFIIYPFNN